MGTHAEELSILYQSIIREEGNIPPPEPMACTSRPRGSQVVGADNVRALYKRTLAPRQRMFPWSALFLTEPRLPDQRSLEETVSIALLKHTRQLHRERATEGRRWCSSSTDYWLAANPPKHAYELIPGEEQELQDLCAKIPPSQCGPVILRFRKPVREFEPDVTEVAHIFRSVLSDCLEEDALGLEEERWRRQQASRFHKLRSKSLSLVTFRSKFHINPFQGRGLAKHEGEPWSVEEEEEGLPTGIQGRTRRVRSMPDIAVTEINQE